MIDSGKVIRPLRAKLDKVKADGLDVMLCSTEIIENVITLLKEQETVVRCKDCVKGSMVVQVGTLPYISCFGEDRPLDWFCADGRKNE